MSPIHAASGVGYGLGFAGNTHRHVPDGWVPAVKFLVEELGFDVNARDHNGYTPLHHAAARGDDDLILYLVSKGADVKAVARSGQTTVDMANGPVQRIQPYPEDHRAADEAGGEEQQPLHQLLALVSESSEERPEQGDLRFRRRCPIDSRRDRVQRRHLCSACPPKPWRRRATRSRPVFPLQAPHARELLRVRGHKCRAASSGLAGEKDIIGADRSTYGFELRANSARGARIVFVEESPLERAAKERLEPLSVAVLPLALRNAVPQFERNDR